MQGIKLGEMMQEGKVKLNGLTYSIVEIKKKDGIVWPVSHEAYVILSEYSWNYAALPTSGRLVAITSNCDYSVRSTATWLTYSLSNNTITISASENTVASTRTASIEFVYEGSVLATFTATQSAATITYTLTQVTPNYSSLTYLLPTGANYASLTAKYNKVVNGHVVSSEDVVPTPSTSDVHAIITSGKVYWNTGGYGRTTIENDFFVSITATYSGLSQSVNVTLGHNRRTASTYEYERSFTIPSLVGNIPASGGSYTYNSRSFVTETYHWESLLSQTQTPRNHVSTAGSTQDVTLDRVSFVGAESGTVTFAENLSLSQNYHVVTMDSEGFTFYQTGATPYVRLSSNVWNPSAMASYRTINITSNCQWTMSVHGSWISTASTTSTSTRINVTENLDDESRYGYIDFVYNGQVLATFAITQDEAIFDYTLTDISVHYSSGTYLLPNQSNNAYVEGHFNTYINGTEHPEYMDIVRCEVSGSDYIAYGQNDTILWNKPTYGKTSVSSRNVSLTCTYETIRSEESAVVGIGANSSQSSYEAQRSFYILGLTGNVPASGGTYTFEAESYIQETKTWTSGEVETFASTSHTSSISSNATLSISSVTGTQRGTITFSENTQTYTRSLWVDMSSSITELDEWDFTQSAGQVSHTLTNLQLHYSAGSYLRPNQSNYAWVTANYNTYVGSRLDDTEVVSCDPVYTISPSYREAIVTEGSSMYWDKDTYGATEKASDYISARGAYAGLTTSGSVSVSLGANTSSITSYTYRKSFAVSISGNIPAEGGTYYFNAESYRTGHGTWTSGETYTGTEEAYASTLSCDTSVTLSHTSISGSIRGTVAFPENESTVLSVTYTFDLYNAGGHSYESYTQEKSVAPYFYIDPSSLLFPSEGGTKYVTVHSNYPSFSVSGRISWASYTVSGDTIAVTAIGPYTIPRPREGSYTITAEGGPSITLDITQVSSA